MSEGKQPFTEYATKAQRGRDASRWGWIAAGILAVLLVVSLLLWASAVGKLRGLESLQTKLDDANASLASAQDETLDESARLIRRFVELIDSGIFSELDRDLNES